MTPMAGGSGTATSSCAHHWRIAENRTRYSEGVCVHCGVRDLFDNWAVEDRGMTWDENAKYRMRPAVRAQSLTSQP